MDSSIECTRPHLGACYADGPTQPVQAQAFN